MRNSVYVYTILVGLSGNARVCRGRADKLLRMQTVSRSDHLLTIGRK
jgi:hypothetical protein